MIEQRALFYRTIRSAVLTAVLLAPSLSFAQAKESSNDADAFYQAGGLNLPVNHSFNQQLNTGEIGAKRASNDVLAIAPILTHEGVVRFDCQYAAHLALARQNRFFYLLNKALSYCVHPHLKIQQPRR